MVNLSGTVAGIKETSIDRSFQLVKSILRKGARMIPLGRGLRALCPGPLTRFLARRLQDLDSPIEVQGQNMFVDPLDSLGLVVWGTYEERETQVVRRIVKPGDVAFDAGAHIGITNSCWPP